jgi:hypothetical protein
MHKYIYGVKEISLSSKYQTVSDLNFTKLLTYNMKYIKFAPTRNVRSLYFKVVCNNSHVPVDLFRRFATEI